MEEPLTLLRTCISRIGIRNRNSLQLNSLPYALAVTKTIIAMGDGPTADMEHRQCQDHWLCIKVKYVYRNFSGSMTQSQLAANHSSRAF